jgi:hypothetical protein
VSDSLPKSEESLKLLEIYVIVLLNLLKLKSEIIDAQKQKNPPWYFRKYCCL